MINFDPKLNNLVFNLGIYAIVVHITTKNTCPLLFNTTRNETPEWTLCFQGLKVQLKPESWFWVVKLWRWLYRRFVMLPHMEWQHTKVEHMRRILIYNLRLDPIYIFWLYVFIFLLIAMLAKTKTCLKIPKLWPKFYHVC